MKGETMLLNMGPQHPSTHGVLRLLLELDGETVINCIPDIGFLHTGIEKNMEAKTYQKAEVMTDRLDYMNPIGNNLAYCLAVEKLVDLDVPARAQAHPRHPGRTPAHLLAPGLAGHLRARPGGHVRFSCTASASANMILDIFELVSGQRMMTTYIRPGGVWRDVPVEFEAAVRDFLKIMPKRIDEYEVAADQESAVPRPHRWGSARFPAKTPSDLGRDRRHAARFRRQLRSAQVRAVFRL